VIAAERLGIDLIDAELVELAEDIEVDLLDEADERVIHRAFVVGAGLDDGLGLLGGAFDSLELAFEILAVAMHGVLGDVVAVFGQPVGEVAVAGEALGDDLGVELGADVFGKQIYFRARGH
jgi:hypothetical protein